MMSDSVKFLRETNIRHRKKPVATNLPTDIPLTDPRKVFDLFVEMQNELKEKLVSISLDSIEVVAITRVPAPDDVLRRAPFAIQPVIS